MSNRKKLPILNSQQRLQLIESLLQRQDKVDKAEQAFRTTYPNASDEMIKVAIFHVYVDGINAAIDWLANAELFLQNSDYEIDDGITSHLLYHLYNWQQFKVLLPTGVTDILETLKDLKEAIADNDTPAILEAADNLEERLGGHLNAPEFHSL